MKHLAKTKTLLNGVEMPILGYGTWQTPDDVAQSVVYEAIKTGYRHIDTAAVYGNEVGVGAGIAQAIADGLVTREELFITTKLWNDVGTSEGTTEALKASLAKLGLTYLDLYLIHWPNPAGFRDTIGFAARNAAVWEAFEAAYAAGKVRAIGISNFYQRHIAPLLETAKIRPMVNQILLNPAEQEDGLVEYNEELGMINQAYSPLGRGEVALNPVIAAIGEKYEKSAAQVVIRWHFEKGFVPLPKSVTPSRIAENFDVFDFSLTEEDIAAIDALKGQGEAVASDPDEKTF
ncbi:MAG: aldo/keto reductase [Lactobacillales bacterium]|jgi:diketogulonate reductase-like aldo/keto reductase|nr:aldo/keto reductase [Lactobacillales bacterium]